jgi:hypothetical protein
MFGIQGLALPDAVSESDGFDQLERDLESIIDAASVSPDEDELKDLVKLFRARVFNVESLGTLCLQC